MCLFRKNKADKKQPEAQEKRGLNRHFYDIYEDVVLQNADNNSEKEAASLGRLFYSIFSDSVESKNLTKEEKHRLYLEQNRKSIISAYNGDNVRELSLLYHCSQSDIIKILRESIAKNDKNCLANSSIGS